MLVKVSSVAIVITMTMILSAPANAGFGGRGLLSGGCRPFHRQVRVIFGRPFYGARFCGGIYYGACWRWQITSWGWQLIRVCGEGYGYPLAY